MPSAHQASVSTVSVVSLPVKAAVIRVTRRIPAQPAVHVPWLTLGSTHATTVQIKEQLAAGPAVRAMAAVVVRLIPTARSAVAPCVQEAMHKASLLAVAGRVWRLQRLSVASTLVRVLSAERLATMMATVWGQVGAMQIAVPT